MKKTEISSLIKKKTSRIAAGALAAMLVFGGGLYNYESRKDIPELVTYVDVDGSIEIAEDDTPLAAPKVTKSVKKTSKTKKIKLKKKSKRTYTEAAGSNTKKSTSTSKSGNVTTTIETVVDTSVMNSFKKGSKVEKQTTTTTTTITKTEITQTTGSSASSPMVTVAGRTTVTSNPANASSNGPATIKGLASKADARVLNAYETLGFKLSINANASYSGLFDARTQTITLRRKDDTVYHELGHFVAFIAGNVDLSSGFKAVYAAEKGLYKDYNKAYITSSASEYFAESFKNYTLNPGALKSSRPQTYAAIEAAVNKITNSQVSRVASVYGSIWNK